ncbi:MAG: DUF4442 domain-containing protein [Flavobacteriales bacterium]|nr:DUF4442 domain-containing protein [Flavobacteriales bacterium]
MELSSKTCALSIALRRRTKNHLGSLYIAAFTIGADLCSGLLAFHVSRQNKLDTSISFKSFSSQYLKRAMSDVTFKCDQGSEIERVILESASDGMRRNQMIRVDAYCKDELVAQMEIELSVKVRSTR